VPKQEQDLLARNSHDDGAGGTRYARAMAGRRACLRVGLGLGASLILGLFPFAASAAARTAVALELVLALDISASVDSDEFALQLGGIAAAFRDPGIIAAIERSRPGGIAVAIVEWSEPQSTKVVVPFHQLVDARTARAFAFLASRAPRVANSSYTSIGAGISAALDLMAANAFTAPRRVIDVSGDGRNNRAPYPDQVRPRVIAAGVTINGLAIETDDDTLTRYYRQEVIVGPDAFVERARNYNDYAEHIRRKLLREILPPLSRLAPGTDVAARESGP